MRSLRLTRQIELLDGNHSLDELRGFEGDSAHIYFDVFDHLIVAQKDAFRFDERNRRPPLDNVNCLLSFIYTLLMHDVRSALETVGLDPGGGLSPQGQTRPAGTRPRPHGGIQALYCGPPYPLAHQSSAGPGQGVQKDGFGRRHDERRYAKDRARGVSGAQTGRDHAPLSR